MSNETQTTSEYDRRSDASRRVKTALAWTSGVALSLLAAHVSVEATKPDFSGEHTVRIEPGDTLSDIAKTEVDGGASHTGETVHETIDRNPKVFPDGKASIGSEDIGETIDVPDKVN